MIRTITGLGRPVWIGMLLCVFMVKQACSQKTSNFFGINPGITLEPYYQKGEFDINVFPLVWQRQLYKQVDLRLNSIVNLGIRNSGNKISHYGLELAIPFMFSKKEISTGDSQGFYLAWVTAVTRNQTETHSNIGLWLEPGFLFHFNNRLGLSLGVQWGATRFYYDSGYQEWGSHFGFKAIFGKWF